MVLGGQPLDELQHWVTDLFSAVPSGKGPRPTYFDAGMPYKVRFLCFLVSHFNGLLTVFQPCLTESGQALAGCPHIFAEAAPSGTAQSEVNCCCAKPGLKPGVCASLVDLE